MARNVQTTTLFDWRFTAMTTPFIEMTEQSSSEVVPERRTMLLAYKSELLGELAEAIGNRFNNTMMAITGHVELQMAKANERERRNLEMLLDHATQATVLIQKLLNFSHGRTAVPQDVNLNQELNDIGDLLLEVLGESVDLEITLAADSGVIHIDRAELEQVLFGLVVNARKAIMGEGKVTVTTELVNLGHEAVEVEFSGTGKHLAITVESCGRMGALAIGQASSSEASCLSLVSVRQIVERYNGTARFTVTPSVGASFKLFFPLLARVAKGSHDVPSKQGASGPRTILVVEDDDAVRVPAVEFLMMEGFKVLQARTGKEALHVVQQSRSSLDLLITDIFMPKMNGHEVAAELLTQNPDLKVLYISGDPGGSARLGANLPPNVTLRKPFRLNSLRNMIHNLLGR
jgi:two-component system, cell cycle sensor histidine kinase and response regulator CckA